jgi:SPP1 gp7 family putative phage head morphogenesis protein
MKIRELFKAPAMSEGAKSKEDLKNQYSKAYKLEDVKKLEEKVNLKEKNYSLNDLGAYTFKTSLFKSELKTPHFEIQKSLEMYEDMPNINAGINQIVLFITGNEVKITSTDEYTNKWFEKWQEQRAHITDSVKNIILHSEVCGNTWIEPVWSDNKGEKYLNDFKVMPDPTRVYYNLTQDADLENEFWIYQVPYIFRQFGDMNIKIFRISYVKNGIAWQETVYGVGLKEEDLIHIKTGTSRYGYYGRSYLASTINDGEIITQMLKNYAIASRFMAFGKKLVSLGDENDIVSTDELEKFTAILNSPEDEEHIAINKKATIQDINPSSFNEMSGGMDYVRKDIGAGLLPNFMTPWADTMGSYASTNNAKIPFELSLENKRNSYVKLLNEYILKPVMKQNPKLKDATFEFGEVTLDDSKDTQTTLLELYNNDVITLNQLLKGIGRETIVNGDIYKTTRNYIYQKKYQMDQTDVEQLEEPFIQRQIQRDMKVGNDNTPETGKSEMSEPDMGEPDVGERFGENLKKNFKESLNKSLKFLEDDSKFIKEIKKRNNIEIDRVVKREFVEDSNILRIVKDKKDIYYLFNNLTLINDSYEEKNIKKFLELELEKTKLEYNDFLLGETEEDKLSDELFKTAKELHWEITKEVIEEIKKNTITEKFSKSKNLKEKKTIMSGVLDKINDMFSGFNDRLQGKLDEVFNRLFKDSKNTAMQYKVVGFEDDLKKKHLDFDMDREIEIDVDLDNLKRKFETEQEEKKKKLEINRELINKLTMDQFKTFGDTQSQNIKRILTDGIMFGKKISEIEKEIKEATIDKKYQDSDNDYKIKRIAKTEVHRSALQIKLMTWDADGVKFVRYLTHLDDRVRPEHRKLHNRIFTIQDALGLKEWREINCRCTFVPVIM